MKRIHIIACGGAVMHNIAIALHLLGNKVTGSDDEIFEPALSRLLKYGLLPQNSGWDENNIDNSIDFIILGMHAKKDNPELIKAQKLNIKIYSFPDYVYQHAIDKKRVVIGGSHGKTTTTAMVMHVLKKLNIDFDYLVGSQLDGFETMVKFSKAPLMIIEGDEYLTSALDPVPKFLKYHPHIALITGIAWDHINVFPTFDIYLEQFKLFVKSIEKDGTLIYFKQDKVLNDICIESQSEKITYDTPQYHIRNGQTIVSKAEKHTLNIFGEHNIQNAEGAFKICSKLGISEKDFYESIKDFSGTAKRLEKLKETNELTVIRDFAHSPSKLKASMNAVRNQYPNHLLLAVYELHTFSSLNKAFLPEYLNTMKDGDINLIYYNPKVIEHKHLSAIDAKDIEDNFGNNTEAINDIKTLQSKIKKITSNVLQKPCVLLIMSSGNFDNVELWS